ncbi:bolA-like protein 2 isoform X9 [Bos mutus]|uniref:bolA-like protein 2 isoform X9 n=1 Tax=Bos mutus TaxID=72004 RepID=UPI0038B63EA6
MPRVQVEGSPQAPSSLNIPGTSGSDHREVEDTTPNRCASSFRVLVVSAKFEGKPLLQRHRFPGPGELRPGPGRSHRQGSSGSRTVQERL